MKLLKYTIFSVPNDCEIKVILNYKHLIIILLLNIV